MVQYEERDGDKEPSTFEHGVQRYRDKREEIVSHNGEWVTRL